MIKRNLSLSEILTKQCCLILLVMVLPILSACDSANQNSSKGESISTSIVVIGDSISNGHNITDPWTLKFADELGIALSNNSISGEQTSYGLNVIENLLNEHKPEHVIIMLGTNDAARGSVPTAISNLQKMVDIARAHDVNPVVATLPPIGNSASRNVNTAKISDGIRELNNAKIVEVRNAFGDAKGLLADGVHPNAAGQKVIADAFLAVF